MNRVRSAVEVGKFLIWRRFNDFSPPGEPSLDGPTRELLEALMSKSKCYLEYGTGGSTVLAARLVQGPIVGVESDGKYLDAVRSALPADRDDISLLYVNVGLTRQWGKPLLPWQRNLWPAYPEAPWPVLGQNVPDLVFIDGRFRVACALEALLRLPEGWEGTIIMDDYEGRQYYTVVEQFAHDAHRVGRALVFGRGSFDRAKCEAALRTHKTDYR